ncbi:ABC transporter ATP-binding protein [Kocuria sp. HSID16901]|uniref:ABC transporter ATP-binding protein n=1 Tax=Kocuria sp. HSID16901 TaxID=2419505 RepID=UPI0006600A7B|nr:ABC transporter ATP-binding protein [Kocuria sp. HSID16901]RUQ22574.1 ABC transporter ATP-binding protein [Kocuria sp. HSID16901]
MSAVLELVNVSVVRGQGQRLIDGITWTVREGERWAVLGPNGAGKSTLMSVCAARLHPTSGMVDILDEILGAVDVFELRPRIGLTSGAIASQFPASEKVRDVVVTAAYGVTGRWREGYDQMDHERAQELLEQWGVSHLSDRTFGSLSDGERKRVLIARALMTDPELMILDEPGAGMDIAGREDLVARLTDLAQDPDAPTTLLVTHHLEELPRGLTHLLLLNHGRVVAQGPIDEVLTSENLSEAYEMPLKLTSVDGRHTAFSAN